MHAFDNIIVDRHVLRQQDQLAVTMHRSKAVLLILQLLLLCSQSSVSECIRLYNMHSAQATLAYIVHPVGRSASSSLLGIDRICLNTAMCDDSARSSVV